MDIYILDDSLRRTETVEQYQSMIWTERYSEYGDFELVIDPDIAEPSLFSVGTRLAIAQSDRIMVVDTTEKAAAEDGVEKLTIKGKSLEDILNQRMNRVGLTPTGPLVITDFPVWIVEFLVDDICRTNTAITADRIPFLQSGTIGDTGSIDPPFENVTVRLELDTLYNTVKMICDTYRFGFRIVRNGELSELFFEVYTGNDLTVGQTDYDAVVFSPQLDNLTDTKELTSTALLKTVAYVFAPNGTRVVYAEGVDPTISGFSRKVLLVQADDITLAAGSTLDAALDQRGKQELANYRIVVGFDGEISQTMYKYGIHYALGDIVTKRGEDGNGVNMKVVEQIFISDAEGERSYPTLAIDTLVVAGSWDAVAPNKVWNDYTTETWNTV